MARRPAIKLPPKPEPVAAHPEPEEPKQPKKPKPVHASLYLPQPVHEELRKIAFETRRSQHDLMIDAVYQWLERYRGKSVDDLLAQFDYSANT
jgi:hypothetical protein